MLFDYSNFQNHDGAYTLSFNAACIALEIPKCKKTNLSYNSQRTQKWIGIHVN